MTIVIFFLAFIIYKECALTHTGQNSVSPDETKSQKLSALLDSPA